MHCARSLSALAATLCSVSAPAQVDLVVADLVGVTHWTGAGAVGGVRAYSFGLQTCNWGTAPASWNANTPAHPAFVQNIHRVSAAGIEQIGMGFAFHAYFPLQGAFCTPCNASGGFFLGDGCSTTDTSSILGQQQTLGPRSGVNASTGALVFPLPATACAGAACERVQVNESDLLHAGATYIAETVVAHAEDAAAANGANNATYRRMQFAAGFGATFSAPAVAEEPAVNAWREHGAAGAPDTRVRLWSVDVPGDGRFAMGARATQVSGTDWRYDYAVENVNSDRSAGAFAVPHAGAPVSALTFRDVDYHSGEAYDPTDWAGAAGASEVRWASTQTFAQNQDANALRWGTLYNYGFTASAHPVFGRATIELFKPGGPASVAVFTVIPGPPPCPGDATGDNAVTFADLNTVLTYFGGAGAPVAGDVTADGVVNFADLNVVLGNFGNGC